MSKDTLFEVLKLRASRVNTIDETVNVIKENRDLEFTDREKYDIIRTICGVPPSWGEIFSISNMDKFLSNLKWDKKNNLEWIAIYTKKRDKYKINTIQWNKNNALINELTAENVEIDLQLEHKRTLNDLKLDEYAKENMDNNDFKSFVDWL